ncbi:cation:proton antiporter [Cohnella laeviribosi]|uniref:cation:proton antiporter n=1 Tax=Cohnella laeviribosi TaxID=380174 RepID=UPI000372A8E4|nr:cation:proton antiporter [Cohnella laeviribosi]
MNHVVEFLLQLTIILIATKLAGDLAARLGQPSVLGQLLAGVLIGPAVASWVEPSVILEVFAQIGVLLLMFLAGLETDLRALNENRNTSIAVAVGGMLFPLAGGYTVGLWLGMEQGHALFLGLLLSATSVSISVQTFRELGKLNSRESTTVLGAAIVDDILVVFGLTIVLGLLTASEISLAWVIGKKVIFIFLAVIMVWKGIPFALRKFAHLKRTEPVLGISIFLCLIFSLAEEYFGVAGIIGAFAAGLAISRTEFKHQIEKKLEAVAYSFFVPVFLASIGLTVSFDGLSEQLLPLFILSVLAIASKLIGSGLGARITGFDTRSSFIIGSGMVSRGEVALIIAALGLNSSLLPSELYTMIILVIVITTVVVPPLLKWFLKDTGGKTKMNQDV